MNTDVLAIRAQLHKWIDNLDAEVLLALNDSVMGHKAAIGYTLADIAMFYERAAGFKAGTVQASDADTSMKKLRHRAANLHGWCTVL